MSDSLFDAISETNSVMVRIFCDSISSYDNDETKRSGLTTPTDLGLNDDVRSASSSDHFEGSASEFDFSISLDASSDISASPKDFGISSFHAITGKLVVSEIGFAISSLHDVTGLFEDSDIFSRTITYSVSVISVFSVNLFAVSDSYGDSSELLKSSLFDYSSVLVDLSHLLLIDSISFDESGFLIVSGSNHDDSSVFPMSDSLFDDLSETNSVRGPTFCNSISSYDFDEAKGSSFTTPSDLGLNDDVRSASSSDHFKGSDFELDFSVSLDASSDISASLKDFGISSFHLITGKFGVSEIAFRISNSFSVSDSISITILFPISENVLFVSIAFEESFIFSSSNQDFPISSLHDLTRLFEDSDIFSISISYSRSFISAFSVNLSAVSDSYCDSSELLKSTLFDYSSVLTDISDSLLINSNGFDCSSFFSRSGTIDESRLILKSPIIDVSLIGVGLIWSSLVETDLLQIVHLSKSLLFSSSVSVISRPIRSRTGREKESESVSSNSTFAILGVILGLLLLLCIVGIAMFIVLRRRNRSDEWEYESEMDMEPEVDIDATIESTNSYNDDYNNPLTDDDNDSGDGSDGIFMNVQEEIEF
jgi:hypothetical protein